MGLGSGRGLKREQQKDGNDRKKRVGVGHGPQTGTSDALGRSKGDIFFHPIGRKVTRLALLPTQRNVKTGWREV